MSDLPRVTYIICHHNYDDYLEGAINSAQSQTYPGQINICVIDDCSDNYENICNIINNTLFDGAPEVFLTDHDKPLNIAYKGNDRAIYIMDKAYGPSYARNRGIELMWDETDIFAILDADDENYQDKIDQLVIPFIQSDEVGVVYADYHILNVDTGSIVYEYKEPFDIFRLYKECIVHSGSLINKKALELVKDQFGFYDEEMRTCEDYDLWVRIADITNMSIIHVPEPLSLVRTHNRNSTNSVHNSIWNRNWARIRDKRSQRVSNEHYRMHSTSEKIHAGKK